MAKSAFPTVPGSKEISRRGNFEGETLASAFMEAPVAFPLALGFIEVSVHGGFELRAGPANISVAAVALPSSSAEGEIGVLGYFDLHAFLTVRLSITIVAFPAGAVVFNVSMLRHRLIGFPLTASKRIVVSRAVHSGQTPSGLSPRCGRLHQKHWASGSSGIKTSSDNMNGFLIAVAD
jgi:hypothetical protein